MMEAGSTRIESEMACPCTVAVFGGLNSSSAFSTSPFLATTFTLAYAASIAIGMTVVDNASSNDTLRIFVTVGTTRFDSLIRAVLSQPFLDAVAQLAPRSGRAQLVVQYGNSSIADILTSSALASVDEGSEMVPEPGMRVVDGRRVYQSGAKVGGLDPGQTGTISGLRLRTATTSSEDTVPRGGASRVAGKRIFDSLLTEAKAMQGFTTSTTYSALQGASLHAETNNGVELQLFQFAPDLKSHIQSANIVISHAGSGTILDTLRMRPKPPTLVVVPNTSLMDNHQVELAEALARDGFVVMGSEETLAEDVGRASETRCERFPDFDADRFAGIVDDLMQF